LNDLPAAIRDFRRLHAMADSPAAAEGLVDPVLATYVLGFLLQRAGNYDEAITCYEQALTEDLGLWMAHVQLARIHEARSEWVDAIRERNQALEAEPDEASLLLDLGITLALAGRSQEALPVLERAGAKLPHNFRVLYFEGIAALQLDRPADARRAFERVLTLVPSRNVAEIAEVRGRLAQLP
jgi:tetratricopeptide (TPR) repeat protein